MRKQFVERLRRHPDALRAARHHRRPRRLPGRSAAAPHRALVPIDPRRCRRAGRQHAPVLREQRGSRALVSRDRRRLVEGRHQAQPGRRLRHRALGALPAQPTILPSSTTSPTVEPEMLATVVDLWWREAERNGVLPLDDRGFELFSPPRPSERIRRTGPTAATSTGPPCRRCRRSRRPPSAVAAFDLTARVTVEPGDEGVLWATGTENSGFSDLRSGRQARRRLQLVQRPHRRRVVGRRAGR